MVAIRTTRYPLILILCCDVFIFVVKQGVPSDEDLERLSQKLDKWKTVGRRLEIEEAKLTAFDNDIGNGLKKSTKCYYIGKRGMAQLPHTWSYMMHCAIHWLIAKI